MTATTSVFLPDKQEHKKRKRSAQSARPNAHGSDATDSADPYTEIQKLNEHELKAAIKSVWKKHEEGSLLGSLFTRLARNQGFHQPERSFSDRVPVCRIVFLGRGGSEIDSVKQRFLFGG
jgi:hypothetical protein